MVSLLSLTHVSTDPQYLHSPIKYPSPTKKPLDGATIEDIPMFPFQGLIVGFIHYEMSFSIVALPPYHNHPVMSRKESEFQNALGESPNGDLAVFLFDLNTDSLTA